LRFGLFFISAALALQCLEACWHQLVGFRLMKTAFSVFGRKPLWRILFFILIPPLLASFYGRCGTAQSLSASAPDASYSVSERARSSFDFVNRIGVITHLNDFDRTYDDFGLVERELRSVGSRHLRA
jgi:hypothetical protein